MERYIIACTESVCGGENSESSDVHHFSGGLVSESMLFGSPLCERHKMTESLIDGSPSAFYMVVADGLHQGVQDLQQQLHHLQHQGNDFLPYQDGSLQKQ
jgi:hypothetical protein